MSVLIFLVSIRVPVNGGWGAIAAKNMEKVEVIRALRF